MTQQEHLLLIRAKCVELLELAKLRTPGRGEIIGGSITQGVRAVNSMWNRVVGCDIDVFVNEDPPRNSPTYRGGVWSPRDAAFIASAAGPFEAALASTVAAIDGIIDPESSQTTHDWNLMHNRFTVKQIITSWPLELLQQ